MPVTPPLSANELSEWIGEPITDSEDQARAGRVLAYAWTLINTETGRDNSYWEQQENNAGQPQIPENVLNVALQVAGRGYTNPESWGNERVDDWGGGARPIEELGMYLTPTEKRILTPWVKTKMRGIGTISTTRSRHKKQPGLVPTDENTLINWY